MHIALARNKFAFSQLRERSRQEDLVTSMVLGTLKYLPARQVAGLFASALDRATTPDTVRSTLRELADFSTAERLHMTAEFWPNGASAGRIEPDAIFEFQSMSGEGKKRQVTLMFECKWNSGLSNPDQLRTQWQIAPKAEKTAWIHIYLVKELVDGLAASQANHGESRPSSATSWNSRACVMTWRHLVESTFCAEDNVLSAWRSDIRRALSRLGVYGFHGFLNVGAMAVQGHEGRIYWHDMRGFSAIAKPVVALPSGSVFWQTMR